MKKADRTLYIVTLVMSMAIGFWTFFVPHMFDWYEYLPTQYENLIAGIDYTNCCFSALLFGSSLLGLIWTKRAVQGNREAQELSFFLTIIWVFRAVLSDVLEPWPLEPIAWAAILQAAVASALALMMVILSIRLLKMRREKSRKEAESEGTAAEQ